MSDQSASIQPHSESVSAIPGGLRVHITLDAKIDVTSTTLTTSDLKATAAAAVQESDKAHLAGDLNEPARVDSTQNSSDKVPTISKLSPESSTLDVKASPPIEESRIQPEEDSIANSPTLYKHTIRVEEGAANTLPAVQPASPTQERTAPAISPSAQSLPSFRQLTGQLTELAEVATQQDPRMPPAKHHHSHSIGSGTSPSPLLPYFPAYANSTQTSPATAYQPSYGPRSPTSIASEGNHYGSPQQHAATAYYTHRRRSSARAEAAPSLPPSMPSLPSVPSLPSGSSAESYARNPSSTDGGYSTTHTTPIDGPAPTEGIQRPILPPPPGLSIVPADGFKCDFPGCTALPFQTQYLLSSHRNVHSQSRPHYCPVKECPRSEGGKGFKRKNEMIRHGLVHNSPGYVCPFCPDREHRYPRPDNLQRYGD